MFSRGIEIDERAQARCIRVAICGEVSSGKSTVLNTILRAKLLPDNLGSTIRPTVLVRHSTAPAVEIVYADGRTHRADRIDDPDLLREAREVVLSSDQPHLAGIELVEVPMTKAEELTDAQIEMARSADVIVWVTIASQAWRLTEKTIVEVLGDARPAHGILALTRADKLRSEADRKKLQDRMERETAAFFQHSVFVSGSHREIGNATNSPEAWAKTGGTDLVALLETLSQQITTSADDVEENAPVPVKRSAVIDLARYRLVSTNEANDLDENVDMLEQEQEQEQAPENTVVESPPVPEPAPAVAPEPVSEPVPTAFNAEAETALRAAASDLPAAVCVGILAPGFSSDCLVLSGDETEVKKAADACIAACDVLADTYSDGRGLLEACVFAMANNHLLFQLVPNVGLIFLMAGNGVMNMGSAQRTLARLARTCTNAD